MERHSPKRDGSKPQSAKLETSVSKVRIVSVERGSDCRCQISELRHQGGNKGGELEDRVEQGLHEGW